MIRLIKKIQFKGKDNRMQHIANIKVAIDHYNKKVHCFISAYAGDVRLIDNHFIC